MQMAAPAVSAPKAVFIALRRYETGFFVDIVVHCWVICRRCALMIVVVLNAHAQGRENAECLTYGFR